MDSYIQILSRFQKSKKFLVTVEELFAYFFGIYTKFGYKSPSILPLFDSVEVAT